MTTTPSSFPRRAIVALSMLTWTGTLFAQSLPAPAPSKVDVTKAKVPAEVVSLEPYTVKADPDNSYGALESNSITGFNARLENMPLSADIFSQAFMKDTGATTMEALLREYSAGAGMAGLDPSSTAASNQPLDRNANAPLQVRGSNVPLSAVNGFMSMGMLAQQGTTGVGLSSTFDTERVEIINGPQALLYGGGGAGGVVNVVTRQARLGQPAFGSVSFDLNKYGYVTAKAVFGFSKGQAAAVFATINGTLGDRRQDIGGRLSGFYGQFAYKLTRLNTTLRLTFEETAFDRLGANLFSVTALSTANDARNGYNLHYLLATGQLDAAASGAPSGGGPILGGSKVVNWDNVDSYDGWLRGDLSLNQWVTLSADTRWNRWLTSQLQVGYDDNLTRNKAVRGAGNLYAPNATANSAANGGFPGQWAVGYLPSFEEQPVHAKSIRFSLLATNSFFGGKARSQTSIGADFSRINYLQELYQYYLADSNLNVIRNPAATVAPWGRTEGPTLYFAPQNGPIKYPLFSMGIPSYTLNGTNYVAQLLAPHWAPKTAADPLGVSLGSPITEEEHIFNKGVYGVNYTQWLDNRLNTIVGFRIADAYTADYSGGVGPGASYPEGGNAFSDARRSSKSYNLGADYKFSQWLHPYFNVSDSYNPPQKFGNDINGDPPEVAYSYGGEMGLKFADAQGKISGQLAVFGVKSRNELYITNSNFLNYINPAGINGRYRNPGNLVGINKRSKGAQLNLTYAPTPRWRMRFSASTIEASVDNSTSYTQVFNDQFFANSQGQVTYKDGTVVYVNPTFVAATPVTTAGAPSALPLTIAMMNTPTSPYFANPASISGAINTGSAVGRILSSVVDPVHGAIRTGAQGLPMSNAQIDISKNPNIAGYQAPPGSIPVTTAGEHTVGYPRQALSLTSMYTFAEGWRKGLRLGGSANAVWNYGAFYYYPAGIGAGFQRALWSYPNGAHFNLIAGYDRKFGRVTWSTQLNVSNVLNQYHVVLVPAAGSGFSTPSAINATFSAQPRSWVWTNTFSF
jgi:outer membrane receptor protein involved in Fe transport